MLAAWVPEGTIAGPTAGWLYYGWYGYPYCPTDTPARIIVIMVTTAAHAAAFLGRQHRPQRHAAGAQYRQKDAHLARCEIGPRGSARDCLAAAV